MTKALPPGSRSATRRLRFINAFMLQAATVIRFAALAAAQLATDISARTWAAFEVFVARPTQQAPRTLSGMQARYMDSGI